MLALALTFAASTLVTADDPGLDALSARYERQFHIFNAPFGLELDAAVPDPAHQQLIRDFLAQTDEPSFLAFTTAQGTPLSASDVVVSYGDHGDIGMFGGLPASADAFRYIVLKRDGAPAADVDAARADLLAAIAAMHVYGTITGFPGGVARGINFGPAPEGASVVSQPATCGNAWERADAWHEDLSGLSPGWTWQDDTSTDQVLGYAFALGAFWDAVADDPTIDASVRADLQRDAAAFGHALMEPVDVGASTPIDLVIRDGGGCPTRFHDLNPLEVVLDNGPPLVRAADTPNPLAFNALAALGIIRTLYHVSGDEALRAYYYDELVAARGYPAMLDKGVANLSAMYMDTCLFGSCFVTNFSNVNMAWVAAFGVLRYETDPALQAIYRARLEDQLWDAPGHPHTGVKIQQAFFNVIYAGLRAGGTDEAARAGAIDQLTTFHDSPYFDEVRTNCDDGEIANGACLAIDGTTTITIDSVPGRGGGVAAVDPLPMADRPSSNFEWRNDPRRVNGGGDGTLLAGGDFRVAYWLGRVLVDTADNNDNVSPFARAPDGSTVIGEGEGSPAEGEGSPAEGEGSAAAEGEGGAAEGEGGAGNDGEGEGVGNGGGGEGAANGACTSGSASGDGSAHVGSAACAHPPGGCTCASSSTSSLVAALAALLALRRRRGAR